MKKIFSSVSMIIAIVIALGVTIDVCLEAKMIAMWILSPVWVFIVGGIFLGYTGKNQGVLEGASAIIGAIIAIFGGELFLRFVALIFKGIGWLFS